MSGVTLTYLAGAAVLCAAAAGCTFVARRMRREASVVNKKFAPSRSCLRCLPPDRRLRGRVPASAQAAPTSTGSITVSGTVARSYDATRSLAPRRRRRQRRQDRHRPRWASDAVRDAALLVLHTPACPIPRPPRRKLLSGSTPIPTSRAR